MPKKAKAPKAPKAPKMGRGGIPCCARGGPAPVFQPVVAKKFWGGLAETIGKGMIEDVVGATAKAHGYKRGGQVSSLSIF